MTIQERLARRRWERAYCDLYNMRHGVNTINAFAYRVKLPVDEAEKKLTEYRQRILSGEIPDPRDRRGWR